MTEPEGPSAQASSPLLEVRDLRVHFPILRGVVLQQRIGTVRAVDGVSFSVGRGETLGLVGESGCGKTTTGRAIMRLVTPTAGQVLFNGRDVTRARGAELKRLRRDIQMVFQNPFASLNPQMTIGNIIADPLRVHGMGDERTRRARVQELLGLVGLSASVVNRYPHQFSGGQRQRVGIARALALAPSLIVADEPLSALDVSIQAQTLNLLLDLQAQLGVAYLFISHDLALVRQISGRVAVMYLGHLVEIAPREVLYRAAAHPYTQALLAAVHTPDPPSERRRRRMPLSGEVPSPAAPPSGCPFHPRCPLREQLRRPPECEQAKPVLRDLPDGHKVACHFAEHASATSYARIDSRPAITS